MSLIIANKRIHQRGQEIRKFIRFVNKNYAIPEDVFVHILNFPCVYDSDNNPAFGVFYKENEKIHIELANDIEWYEKVHRQKFSQQFLHYLVLMSLSHEIHHYFQYRDGKLVVENYVFHNSMKLLKEYVWTKKSIITKKYLSQVIDGTSTWTDNDLYAIDPIKLFRKQAKLR